MRHITVALALLALTGTAAADCEPMELVSDGSKRAVTFAGGSVVKSGDQRFGTRAVALNGTPAGTHRWISTIHPTPDGEVTFLNGAFMLGNGEIHYTAVVVREVSAADTSRPGTRTYSGVVVGGTGVFGEAKGTLKTEIEGLTSRYILDIDCD